MPLFREHGIAGLGPQLGQPAMDRVIGWLVPPARRLHGMLSENGGLRQVRHLSLSIHDPASDRLWSFAVSGDPAEFPEIEDVAMANVPSLALLADEERPRVVGDLSEFGADTRFRSSGSTAVGCRSCMTVPIHHQGAFIGFVVFGAAIPHFFRPEIQDALMNYAEAYGILISRAFDAARAAD